MSKTGRLLAYQAAAHHIAQIDTTIVNHSKLRAAHEGLDECIAWSEANREPAGAVLVGEGGMGKTTICNAILRRYPPSIKKTASVEVSIVPAFYASVPSPSSIKSLAAELLKRLGAPRPGAGTASSLTERLIVLLKIAETKIILLDEFQHLLADSKVGDARSNNVCDWIKTLINNTGVTICLVGTPACEALVNSDLQLAGRFARRFRLYPLNIGTSEERGELERFLIAIVEKFKERLGFLTTLDFSDHSNSVRVWAATSGNPRFVMRLLKEAAVLAWAAGRKNLTIGDLAEAYAKGITQSASKFNGNPFVVTYEALSNALRDSKLKM
ncbi:AAA family ATPase [Pseudoduganella sp. FT25W]|uniref:AAA family ATPase n=1 Tax=Duganella alba TaxID=2666081 RepID=A0A6L5QEI0_9BURK|nr:TniB family NTP-binding protein [Duganella alba]MRX08144.1 AAA family ATPase [Duganella alba]MRX16319.1 AAA family ATPase [Duganella alba]